MNPKPTYEDLEQRVAELKQQVAKYQSESIKYRTLFNVFPHGITVSDAAGNILETNAAAEKLLGLKKAAHENRHIDGVEWKIIRPDGSDMPSEEWAGAIALKETRLVSDCKLGIATSSDDTTWLNVTAAPLPLEDHGVVVTYSDITKQMDTLASLKRLASDQAAILDNVPAYIYFKDTENNILRISQSVAKITGLPKNEIEGHHSSEIYPEMADTYWEDDLEVIRSGKPKIGIVEPLPVPGGEPRWLLTDKIPVFDANGIVTGVIVMASDITERIEAENHLIESEERLSLAFRGANDGLWDWDLETDAVFYSPRWKSMLGYEDHEINNQFSEWERLVLPEDLKRAWAIMEDYLKGRRDNFECEFQMRHQNGSLVDILSRAFAIRRESDNQPMRVVGTHVDITERKEMQRRLQQAQKMESIGTLAGGIAHDFNNILASIIGFTELALEDVEKGSELEDSLQEVYAAGRRAMELVKQILAFARRSDEKMEPVEVGSITREVLRFLRSSTPVTIEIQQDISSDALILGNPTQVHQILMNLCTNAIHSMEDSGGRLKVQVRDITLGKGKWGPMLGLKDGDYIEVKVSDTGVGIAAEIMGSIFDPYFTTKGPGEGTGMGLALVHGIVESYGGKIKLESRLGEGTLFTLYLPITQKRETFESRRELNLPTGTERILFVDDEIAIVKAGQKILERLGYTVISFDSSTAALERFKSNPSEFDLVLTDMAMPGMTGDQLALALLKVRPDIPVILCTGFSKKLSEQSASEIGIKAFAYKPLVKADLAKTVRSVLDEAQSEPL